MHGSKSPRSRPISVGIVGAGLAGLRCADVLLQHGFKVTIFEARNRLGGRVTQSRHLGHLVDLGPNWIHGTEENPIYDIARRIGSRLHAWEEEQAMFDPHGNLIDSRDAAEYGDILWNDDFISGAFKYSKEHAASMDAHTSLYDYLEEKAQGLFAEDDASLAQKKREMFLRSTEGWGGWVGTPINRQSLKFFWMEQCMDGENPYVADTYSSILEYVAKHAVEKADIRYGSEVTRIRSSTAEQSGQLLSTIESSDGSITSFDALVVTTPLGWLKRNQAAFQPPLPGRLAQAIDNIGYGTLDKVYISFPSAFWNETPGASATFSNGLDSNGEPSKNRATSRLLKPLQQDKRQHPSISVFLSPDYAPDTNPQRTYQEFFDLSALPDSCAHPTILFYIFGECSQHIANLVSSSPTREEADASLIDFFRPYYSRLPNYDPTNPACLPQAVLASAWANDKWAGYGSYSNFQVGLEHADEDMEVMRLGMPERGIYLAGEHTAPIVASGTTTGAYLSGEGVARRIIGTFEKEG